MRIRTLSIAFGASAALLFFGPIAWQAAANAQGAPAAVASQATQMMNNGASGAMSGAAGSMGGPAGAMGGPAGAAEHAAPGMPGPGGVGGAAAGSMGGSPAAGGAMGGAPAAGSPPVPPSPQSPY